MGSDFFPDQSTSFPSLRLHSRMEERLFEAILPTFENVFCFYAVSTQYGWLVSRKQTFTPCIADC